MVEIPGSNYTRRQPGEPPASELCNRKQRRQRREISIELSHLLVTRWGCLEVGDGDVDEEEEEGGVGCQATFEGWGSGANITEESFHASCKSWSCVRHWTLYDNASLLSTTLFPVNYVLIILSLLCIEPRLEVSAVKINNAVSSCHLASQSVC